MIVFIVVCYDYSQTRVAAVFAKKEDAELYAKEQNEKEPAEAGCTYSVEEFEVK